MRSPTINLFIYSPNAVRHTKVYEIKSHTNYKHPQAQYKSDSTETARLRRFIDATGSVCTLYVGVVVVVVSQFESIRN